MTKYSRFVSVFFVPDLESAVSSRNSGSLQQGEVFGDHSLLSGVLAASVLEIVSQPSQWTLLGSFF